MVGNARKIFYVSNPIDPNPMKMILGVRDLLKRCIVVTGEDRLSQQANENATILFQCLVRPTLCTKMVAETNKLSEDTFNWLLGEIESKLQ